MALITERYADKIAGVLSCYDRVIVQGSLPSFNYADGMSGYLTARGIRIFGFAEYAQALTESIKKNAEAVAAAGGLEIEYVRKKKYHGQEDKVGEVLAKRGEHPGLVWVFSVLESCTTYQPWHDKKTGRTFLKPRDGKCLHYYFYFIDGDLGLCFLRVPTWCPFRVQFYCNGHNWLARRLEREKIRYRMVDNAFAEIDNWERAQHLANGWDPAELHDKLDQFALRYCPIMDQIGERHHWSLETAEYATDIVFRRQADLQAIYGELVRTAIHTVKPDDIATFLGKKLTANFEQEMGNRYNVRIEGTRIKHSMGKTTIKMYDKFGTILRIETTTLDVTFFRHYREVGQKDGHKKLKYAPMKKTIYSLGPLREALTAANRRYLEFISSIDDPSKGAGKLRHLSETVRENGRAHRGFNLFDANDETVFRAISRGEFNISGFHNRRLRELLPQFNSGQISRLLKRLRNHGIIKKAHRSYKYYLTATGRQVVALGLKLKNLVIVPELATVPAS